MSHNAGKGSEEGLPEIRVKQDKMLFLLLILMIACMGIELAVPFFVEVYNTGNVIVYFRFWIVNPSSSTPIQPWFADTIGIVGFATGLSMLALTGVSFTIALVHKANKNLFLEKGAIIPFIIAGFFSLLLIAGLAIPPYHSNRVSWGPISDIAIGACGVVTLVLANVFRVGPWLRAPISWKEALQVKSMEAGLFPILLVLKKLQETKGSIDIMHLTRIFGRFKGTVRVKLERARLTNLIKGQFQGPLSFNLETINLPFIIDDADVPQTIQASVDSMLGRAIASPFASYPPATSLVASPAAARPSETTGDAVFCSGCGASVRGKEFCSNCGKKVA
jgi:hypothetical protein